MYKLIRSFVRHVFSVRGRSKRIYVSGPMTGYPKHNYPAFEQATKKLRKKGYDVISPAELDEDGQSLTWTNCLIRDILFLLTCRYIGTLPGWTKSKGASLEIHIGKDVWTYSGYCFINLSEIWFSSVENE